MDNEWIIDHAEARKRLQEFRKKTSSERLFVHPTSHPSSPTGFCFCDGSFLSTFAICLKAALLDLLLKLPFNRPKLVLLRRMGATVGRRVYISAGAWIDPTFTDLLTIEEDVFIGSFARITLHEYRIDEFRAGRVLIRKGAFVGGDSLIACGVEIGSGATVGAGAVVGRDVPPGATALGNPARLVHKKTPDDPAKGHE